MVRGRSNSKGYSGMVGKDERRHDLSEAIRLMKSVL
jgi:hypothetical protein